MHLLFSWFCGRLPLRKLRTFKLFIPFCGLVKFGVQWFLKTELRTQTQNLVDACSVLVAWMCVIGGRLRARVRAIWGTRMSVSLG